MKQFTCSCIAEQFKRTDQVFVGLEGYSQAEIPCVYRPNGQVTLRRVKLEANFCPLCGAKLAELESKNDKDNK